MIEFRLLDYKGKFEEGTFSLESDEPLAREIEILLADELLSSIALSRQYVPGIEGHARAVLSAWKAQIIRHDIPPAIQDGIEIVY